MEILGRERSISKFSISNEKVSIFNIFLFNKIQTYICLLWCDVWMENIRFVFLGNVCLVVCLSAFWNSVMSKFSVCLKGIFSFFFLLFHTATGHEWSSNDGCIRFYFLFFLPEKKNKIKYFHQNTEKGCIFLFCWVELLQSKQYRITTNHTDPKMNVKLTSYELWWMIMMI